MAFRVPSKWYRGVFQVQSLVSHMNSCWINAKWNKNNTLFGSVKGTEPFFQPCMDTETHNRRYGFPFRIAKLRFVPVGLGFPVTARCRLCLFGKAAREKCQTAQIWPKVPGWQITICQFIEELFFPPKNNRASWSSCGACFARPGLVAARSVDLPGNWRQQKGPLWFPVSCAVMKVPSWWEQRKLPASGSTYRPAAHIKTKCIMLLTAIAT